MTPRCPSGLGSAGRALWREVLADYELSAAERHVLREACRTADEIDRMAAALREAEDLTVPGSTGQLRPHPLWDEVRKHRQVLGHLLGQLKEEA